MEKIVYEFGDYPNGTIAFCRSFETAKMELIDALKELIISYENKLDKCEDVEYARWLRDFIARLEGEIERAKKATPVDSYHCYQFYITKNIVKVD